MSNPTGDAINAFFGVAPHYEGEGAPLEKEISAVKVTFDRIVLYVPFNVKELADSGLDTSWVVNTIAREAKGVVDAHFASAEFIPLMSLDQLDQDKCWAFGPSQFEGYLATSTATEERDDPMTTDVVNGDLDDAEDAFNS